jgi:hypothetical protein
MRGLPSSRHRSQRFVSNAATLKAVVSFTLLAIGTQSPIAGSWNSSRMQSALAQPALSSRSQVYHPARRYPICTIHGQTLSDAASIVTARVGLKEALGTISSPGIGPRTSSSVAPYRVCQGR